MFKHQDLQMFDLNLVSENYSNIHNLNQNICQSDKFDDHFGFNFQGQINRLETTVDEIKGIVNCQNSLDMDPQNSIVPVGRPRPYSIIHCNNKYAFHTQSRIKSKFSNHRNFIYT